MKGLVRILIYLGGIVCLATILVCGCAEKPKKGPSVDEIRAHADRSHEDLKAHERGDLSSVPGPAPAREPEVTPPPRQPEKSASLRKGKRPDWIDGQDARFPFHSYLSGVGLGPDRKTAEDNARSEVAKVFYSEISSENRTYQEYLQTESGGKIRTIEDIDVQAITKVSTDKILSGVQIAEVFQETKPEVQFYALAILDRAQTETILRDRISVLDRELQELMGGFRQQTDRLAKIQTLNQVLQKLILRQAYDTELRIVNRSGSGIPAPMTITSIKQELAAILFRNFRIAIQIKGRNAEAVRQALTEAFTQQGFVITDELQYARIVIRGRVEMTPVAQSQGEWKFVRWNTYFELLDHKFNTILGSAQKEGREGHLTYAQAETRTVQIIRRDVMADIAQKLKAYIFAQE